MKALVAMILLGLAAVAASPMAATGAFLDLTDLQWSTFYGTSGMDVGWALALRTDGKVIVAGESDAAGMATSGAYDATFNGVRDAWIACFDPAASDSAQLVWCTYLGGSQEDRPFHLVLDPIDGSIVLVGITSSSDFPTTAGAYDRTYNGGAEYPGDAFVARLSSDGSALLYSTFLGAEAADWAVDVALSAASDITVLGFTLSSDFPTTEGAYDRSFNNNYDAFVTRLDPSGSSLVFSTYLGGSGDETLTSYTDMRGGGLEIDPSGAVIVGGATSSVDFPTTAGAYQGTCRGSWDSFLARLSPDGDSLEFSTYFGGTSSDYGGDVAITPMGEIVLAGATFSSNMPTTPGAYDTGFNGTSGDDAFVSIFDSQGSQLTYSTFIGGIDYDVVTAITTDALGDVVVIGCGRTGFPTTPNAYDPTYEGNQDAYLLRLRPQGSGAGDLLYSTFIGSTDTDAAFAVALGPDGSIVDPLTIAGSTRSTGFPTTSGAFDRVHNSPGAPDAWILQLVPAGAGVEEPLAAGVTPAYQRLGMPRPNPSRGPIAFAVDLPAGARVRIGVYDVSGRPVTQLLDREMKPGHHELSWNPEVLRGRLAPGTYFIRLVTSAGEETQKVVIEP